MRKTFFLIPCMALLLTACGGQEPAGDVNPESKVDSALETLGEGEQGGFAAVRQVQDEALEATADLVADASQASPEELDEALSLLNKALLQGRGGIAALRTMEPEARRPLTRELRQANLRLREAYDALMAHHPDPESVSLDLDVEPAQ